MNQMMLQAFSLEHDIKDTAILKARHMQDCKQEQNSNHKCHLHKAENVLVRNSNLSGHSLNSV